MKLKLERLMATASAVVLCFLFNIHFSGCTNSGGGSTAGSGRNPTPKSIKIITAKPLPSGSRLEIRLNDSVILSGSFSVDIPDSTELYLRLIPQGDTANAAYSPQ